MRKLLVIVPFLLMYVHIFFVVKKFGQNRPVVKGQKCMGRGDNNSSVRSVSHLENIKFSPPIGVTPTGYLFNCSNIHLINIKENISYGTSKQAFLGEYNGMRVAVKMVTSNLADIRDCIEGLQKLGHDDAYYRARCYGFPNMKLMKEIFLLQELSHPNLVQLHGFCVRGDTTDRWTLREHGVVAVYEYGAILHRDMLRYAPWSERLTHAVEMTSLLCYLDNSPLGSLIFHDFKPMHFLLVGKSIKVIDLDDVDTTEEMCEDVAGSRQGVCDYGLECVGGYCVGACAKHMLRKMNSILFQILLLPVNSPESVVSKFRTINKRLDNLSINASELLQELTSIRSIPLDD